MRQQRILEKTYMLTPEIPCLKSLFNAAMLKKNRVTCHVLLTPTTATVSERTSFKALWRRVHRGKKYRIKPLKQNQHLHGFDICHVTLRALLFFLLKTVNFTCVPKALQKV